jgi:serine protease inhibitor
VRKNALLFILVIAICMCGCGAPQMIEATVPPLPTLETIPTATLGNEGEGTLWSAAYCNDITIRMLQQSYNAKNLMVSGASLTSMLLVLRNAADESTAKMMDAAWGRSISNAGAIRPSVRKILSQYESSYEGNFLAQSILFGEGPTLMVNYLDEWMGYSDIQPRLTDFTFNQDVALVNDWFTERTNGALTKAIQVSLENPNTMLIGAVGIRICWKTGFDTKNTKNKLFNMAEGSTTTASMMNARMPMRYYSDDMVTVVVMEAEDNRQVWLMLPGEGYDLPALLNVLSTDSMLTWREAGEDKQCNLTMPLLRFTQLEDEDTALKNIGMTSLFVAGGASYPVMGQNIHLSHVRQFLSLTVDETGTEISSETGGSHALSPLPNEIPTLTVDKPFLLLVTDKNDVGILLAAAIANTKGIQ